MTHDRVSIRTAEAVLDERRERAESGAVVGGSPRARPEANDNALGTGLSFALLSTIAFWAISCFVTVTNE
jgi:hypothetical protein